MGTPVGLETMFCVDVLSFFLVLNETFGRRPKLCASDDVVYVLIFLVRLWAGDGRSHFHGFLTAHSSEFSIERDLFDFFPKYERLLCNIVLI